MRAPPSLPCLFAYRIMWTEEEELAEMPVELYMLDKLKERAQLAREIDAAQHRVKKEKHERNWLREAAEAMEIELDSDLAR